MTIQEEPRSISVALDQIPLNHGQRQYGQKRRSFRLSLALGMAATVSAMIISSDRAAASIPSQMSQTALTHSSLLTVGIYPTVETAQVSTGANNSSWLYQGIVQLSYAGVIAWVIVLLQNSGK